MSKNETSETDWHHLERAQAGVHRLKLDWNAITGQDFEEICYDRICLIAELGSR